MSSEQSPIHEVRRFYTEKIETHGITAQGVDWRDEKSQEARFNQLAVILSDEESASVADIGCGYGALAPFLRSRGWRGHYEGVDISDKMIEAAESYLTKDIDFHLTIGQIAPETTDFVVASGIFNVKGKTDLETWKRYVYATIDEIVASARKGVAINFLTSWSDAPFMRDDLYYAAPEDIFKYCAARHTRWIELSQDYDLFEFTLRLRLDRRAPRLRVER